MKEAGPGVVAAAERAVHTIGRRLADELSSLGLTQPEIHVLGLLATRGATNIAVIHRSFGHKRSTLTSVLDRLESRGLVHRTVDPANRRSVVVTPTASGRRTAHRVGEAIKAIERGVAARVSARDVEGFLAVLAAIERE